MTVELTLFRLEGSAEEAIAQLGESLQELDGEEFTQASKVIEDHAQAECDITLGE